MVVYHERCFDVSELLQSFTFDQILSEKTRDKETVRAVFADFNHRFVLKKHCLVGPFERVSLEIELHFDD